MASDPRERIETEHLRCVRRREVTRTELFQIRDSDQFALTYTDWPELVAFAKAILAADSEWLDSQTPTLEELRERYPDFYMNVDTHPPTNTTWFAAFYPVGDEMNPRYGSNMESEKAALRWLAAELEKENGGT